ncbi:MAG TPA: RNA polymerase sigma factor [Ilumatobacteraceae bacterium]|nr:RNA polymerase sigma factor [Ilumatobacteraceae bacterium]
MNADAIVEVRPTDPLEPIFRQHYARLVRTLTLLAGDRDLAADAVQDAFVKAHLNWWRIKRYDDPVGWIRRVAINRLRDRHRSSAREQRAITRLIATTTGESSEGTEPVDPAGSGASDLDIQQLLAGLPRQQRIAIALFYVEGLSLAEVAATMRLSVGAVKYHVHQGRARLREALADESEESPDA